MGLWPEGNLTKVTKLQVQISLLPFLPWKAWGSHREGACWERFTANITRYGLTSWNTKSLEFLTLSSRSSSATPMGPFLTRREGACQGCTQPLCPGISSLIAMTETDLWSPETSFISFGLTFWKNLMFTSDWLRTSVNKAPEFPEDGNTPAHLASGAAEGGRRFIITCYFPVALWEGHKDSGSSLRADLSLRILSPWRGEYDISFPADENHWVFQLVPSGMLQSPSTQSHVAFQTCRFV